MKKKRVSRADYFRMCFSLIQLTKDDDLQTKTRMSGNVFAYQSEEIARRYDLDLSDALQIISVKHGRFSKLSHECKSVLVTADAGLLKLPRLRDCASRISLTSQSFLVHCNSDI
jgi:hypothetical protein